MNCDIENIVFFGGKVGGLQTLKNPACIVIPSSVSPPACRPQISLKVLYKVRTGEVGYCYL